MAIFYTVYLMIRDASSNVSYGTRHKFRLIPLTSFVKFTTKGSLAHSEVLYAVSKRLGFNVCRGVTYVHVFLNKRYTGLTDRLQ